MTVWIQAVSKLASWFPFIGNRVKDTYRKGIGVDAILNQRDTQRQLGAA